MANLITVGRLVLLFVVVAMIYFGNVHVVGACMFLIAFIFASDGIDGWVARRRNATSEFGAVFDIAGDRIVENTLWIVFAHLDVVPVWVPILVMTRGFVVDSLRSLSYSGGMTAFGENNMMRSALTRWLTAGRFMRALFGYAKAAGFVFLTGLYANGLADAPGSWLAILFDVPGLVPIGWAVVWTAVVLTVIRGLPVVYDAWDRITGSAGPDDRVATSQAPKHQPRSPGSSEHSERHQLTTSETRESGRSS